MFPEQMVENVFWNPNSSCDRHAKSAAKIQINDVLSTHKKIISPQSAHQSAFEYCEQLSQRYGANIYLKRQDQQKSKSFKIRAAHQLYLVYKEEIENGRPIVAVSDGNYASAIGVICGLFKFKCIIFVPMCCPQHKIDCLKEESQGHVEVLKSGQNLNDCQKISKKYAQENKLIYVNSYESEQLFPAYATIAKEISDAKSPEQIDYVLVPSGGGALVSSIASYFKQTSANTKIIAVEPDSCTPFRSSIENNQIVQAEKASELCNGCSVIRVGKKPFQIGMTSIDGFISISEKTLAAAIVELYQSCLICQPCGALGVAALSKMHKVIAGKSVVCIITGSNMDTDRLQQIQKLTTLSSKDKNYYAVEVPDRKSAVYNLISKCFKNSDKIVIQYSSQAVDKTQQLLALLEVESEEQEDVEQCERLMGEFKYKFQKINQMQKVISSFF